MFVNSSSASKKIKGDRCVKPSSLTKSDSTIERRSTKKERRLPSERRKVFGSLSTGLDTRENKLEQRRTIVNRREADQQSNEKIGGVNKLELNQTSINSLINEQILIAKRITTLLPIEADARFSQTENNIRKIYADIKSLMQKEEYLLCLYLKTKAGKLTKLHIDKLLSIINNDISQLSDELIQLAEKYHIAKINQTNMGFVQLDMIAIREKIIVGLYKKKKHLYPIYLT